MLELLCKGLFSLCFAGGVTTALWRIFSCFMGGWGGGGLQLLYGEFFVVALWGGGVELHCGGLFLLCGGCYNCIVEDCFCFAGGVITALWRIVFVLRGEEVELHCGGLFLLCGGEGLELLCGGLFLLCGGEGVELHCGGLFLLCGGCYNCIVEDCFCFAGGVLTALWRIVFALQGVI